MIISFIIFTMFFLLIVEILTMLFKSTGISEEKARFQVISLLTGTGFTTRESELIMSHPTRRKLAESIMIIGSVSIVTFISFFVNILRTELSPKSLIELGLFLAALLFMSKNRTFVYKIDSIIEKSLFGKYGVIKKASNNKVFELINNSKGYGLYHVVVVESSALVGQTLSSSGLKSKKIQVLNIDKGDSLINAPDGRYTFEKGDNLLVYGKIATITEFFQLQKN